MFSDENFCVGESILNSFNFVTYVQVEAKILGLRPLQVKRAIFHKVEYTWWWDLLLCLRQISFKNKSSFSNCYRREYSGIFVGIAFSTLTLLIGRQ